MHRSKKAPQVPDLFEPVGKLKVDYDVDELSTKLKELKARFREVNFDAVLSSAEELKQAGVTDTTTKRGDSRPRHRAVIKDGHPMDRAGSPQRAAAMLSMQNTVWRELPAGRKLKRVTDLQLPAIPSAPDEVLPVPDGINEWVCLQDAVNSVGKEKFVTSNAQLGWRKWAMMHTNANVMVDLFWWLAATFFCKEDPSAPALREFLYHRFSRHFIKLLIMDTETTSSLQSKLRDTYQRNFVLMTAVAACNLFRAAAPRSAPLFDGRFLEAVMQQLRIWTSGLLPGDSHRASMLELEAGQGNRSPPPAPHRRGGTVSKQNPQGERAWRSHRTTRHIEEAAEAELQKKTTGHGAASPELVEKGLAMESRPKLKGKAARGAFDIAKTSPFVAHFLEHHGIQPNDLNRGLLNRHVCGAAHKGRASSFDDAAEPCTSYAVGPVAAGKQAVETYAKQSKKSVCSTNQERKRLQGQLAHLLGVRDQVTKCEAGRELSNKLANWVDFTKDKAQRQEAERRDLVVVAGEETLRPVLKGQKLKDGIDVLAHYHCQTTKPPERTGGYHRYTTGTSSARIARQARAALGDMYRDYTSTGTVGR